MRTSLLAAALAFAAVVAGPAMATPPRDYCPDRPGLDTPPCTLDPGRASVEISAGDWTHDGTPTAIADTVLLGDLALRLGIADHAEVRLAWSPYGVARSCDRASGAIDRQTGTGDITFGLKRNLLNPDGKGFSLALLPSLTLPTGGAALGAGTWAAGLQMPASLALGEHAALLLTPELDAAADADRRGHHLAFGSVVGVQVTPADGLAVALEGSAIRDEEPAGPATRVLAGLSAGLMLSARTQIDVGTAIGLNSATPDRRIYIGIARRL